MTEIDRTPLLSEREEKSLAARIAEGDVEARDQMVRANLRLVVKIARAYAGQGLALEDLIAEGNVGLLRAVEGYDPNAGTRFSTYAAFWVKQSIRVALNRSGHAVRLPQYMGTLLVKWRRMVNDMRDELGREPVHSEVAERLNLSRLQSRAVSRALKAAASTRGNALAADDFDLADLIADARSIAPEDKLSTADDMRVALGLLHRLGEREAAILRMRFGLDDEGPKTLKEIGRRLGLTRERVRQLEQDALAVLRSRLVA
jgi:RNA polymerase primary sigma factor